VNFIYVLLQLCRFDPPEEYEDGEVGWQGDGQQARQNQHVGTGEALQRAHEDFLNIYLHLSETK
jgi:hypothetical protein